MIKILIFIFFIALLAIVVYDSVLDSKIKYVDNLVKRGADINKVVDKL